MEITSLITKLEESRHKQAQAEARLADALSATEGQHTQVNGFSVKKGFIMLLENSCEGFLINCLQLAAKSCFTKPHSPEVYVISLLHLEIAFARL